MKIISFIFLFSIAFTVYGQSSDVDQKLYQGKITDSTTGKVFRDGLIEVFNSDPLQADFSGRINNESGEYSILMHSAKKYLVRITSPYIYKKEFMFEAARGVYEDLVQDFKVNMIPIGMILFEGKIFKPGSSEIINTVPIDSVVGLMNREKAIVLAFGVWADEIAVTNNTVKTGDVISTPQILNSSIKKKVKTNKDKKVKTDSITNLQATPIVKVEEVQKPTMNEDQIKQLVSDRCLMIRNYFKTKNVSTTRIEFDKNSYSLVKDVNSKISIKMIRLEKDDD